MKHYHILSVLLLFLASCGAKEHTLTVENRADFAREGEMIEVEIDNADQLIVLDAGGVECPSQVTYQGNLIFQVDIAANATNKYKLVKGQRAALPTIATGRVYPEHYDDIAWENDKIGFRIFTKGAEADGSKLYGYDVFTKRAEFPVLDILYALQYDREYGSRINKLKNEDPKNRTILSSSITYHIDHGLGMDYYAVGPTLGCGTAALCTDEGMHYPTYYTSYEVLDAGGLRFTFKVGFDPVLIDGDMVEESRIITLDAGSHFNHVEVEYKNLSKPTEVVAGLVMRDQGENSVVAERYVAYAEPVHIYGWQTYNAILFNEHFTSSRMNFDDEQRKAHGGAYGYLLAEGECTPSQSISYYTGAGWNRWGFETPESWFEYVEQQSAAKQLPLVLSLK